MAQWQIARWLEELQEYRNFNGSLQRHGSPAMKKYGNGYAYSREGV
jgi:hypothetical protein